MHKGSLEDLEVKLSSEISNLMNEVDISISTKEMFTLIRNLLIVYKFH